MQHHYLLNFIDFYIFTHILYILGASDISFVAQNSILTFTPKMIYAYIRVSTDKQTVENQRFEIEKFARIRELNIDKWISETVSGTKSAKKRKLGSLIKKLKKGDTLIASEISRLGRRLMEVMSILNTLMQKI